MDHITTNVHQNIDNITTTLPGISDHGMLIFNLRTNEITENLKYHLRQNWENANPLDLKLLASFNPFLQQIWSNRNVQETWELLDKGIEELSNMLAPTKVVQHRDKFQPYSTEELKDLDNHDKTKFDLFAFSYGPIRNDKWRNEVKKYFLNFEDINKLSDKNVADLIKKNESLDPIMFSCAHSVFIPSGFKE